jgi:opacity protein-like surface antigen
LRAGADILADVRVRGGVALGNFLVYGTVGAGYVHYSVGAEPSPLFGPPGANDNITFDDWGPVYGGGIGFGAGPIVLDLGYLFYDTEVSHDFGSIELFDTDVGDSIAFDGIHTVRLGASFKFGAPPPPAP